MASTNKPFLGLIRLYIGSMFSGKTSALLEAYTRHSIGKRKCLLVKHNSDTRYDEKNVVSHNGRNISSSVSCDYLYEIDNIVNNYQVVCIDEIQFFEDAPIFCDKWANQGIIVEASGLSGTYTRSDFPVISQLIPLAEEVYKKSAVCRETGRDAQFTFRTSSDTETIVIGGDDKYKPVDRQTFFTENADTLKNYEMTSFKKFVELYCSRNNIVIDDEMKSNLWKYFNDNYSSFSCYLDILNVFFQNVKH